MWNPRGDEQRVTYSGEMSVLVISHCWAVSLWGPSWGGSGGWERVTAHRLDLWASPPSQALRMFRSNQEHCWIRIQLGPSMEPLHGYEWMVWQQRVAWTALSSIAVLYTDLLASHVMQPGLCMILISVQWVESVCESGSQVLRPLSGLVLPLKSLFNFDCDVCPKWEIRGAVGLYCGHWLDQGTEERSMNK